MEILKAYKDFFKDDSRVVLVMGGAGSGKSHAITQKILLKMMNEEGHKILVVRKVQRTLKNSVYDLFNTIIDAEGIRSSFTSYTSPMEITFNDNGNKIVFLGLDDVQKLLSFANLTGIWVEEATEITEKDFRQLNLRMRGETVHPKQFILSFNPIDITGWIYKKFFSSEKVYDAPVYKTTYRDNKYLDRDYIKTLEELENVSDMDYRVYNLGEWGALTETQIFKNWQVYNPETHSDIIMDISKYEKIQAGIDFGSTHASVCLIIAIVDDYLLILDEIYMKSSKMTNIDFFQEIQKKNYPRNMIFYVESAEPRSVNEMRRLGFQVISVKKGKDSIRFGLDYLKRFKIIIHPKCENTIREITAYSYLFDERTGTIFNEPEINQQDDTMAALRYSVDRNWRKPNRIKAVPSLY